MLPLPIRLLGKDVINYDENMYFLRKQIFGKDKDSLKWTLKMRV